MQVQAKQSGTALSSGSMLQPLRTAIFDLLKLRRRLEIHADSQVRFLKLYMYSGCAVSHLDQIGMQTSHILGVLVHLGQVRLCHADFWHDWSISVLTAFDIKLINTHGICHTPMPMTSC